MMEQDMKVIIVEDMEDYVSVIEMLIKEVAPWVNIVGTANSLIVAEQLIEELSPDAVLLDIQFENEGRTGFDLLDSIRSRKKLNFQIIVITAHVEKQYYVKAFEYRALHFLEKPVNKLKLADALERVNELRLVNKIDTLTTYVEKEIGKLNSANQSFKINIQGLRFNEIIDIREILWVKADGRRAIVYLCNDRIINSTDNIGTFENQLKCFSNLYRINRSEIINVCFVEKYSKNEKLVILSCNNSNHFISKDRFTGFMEKMAIR